MANQMTYSTQKIVQPNGGGPVYTDYSDSPTMKPVPHSDTSASETANHSTILSNAFGGGAKTLPKQ